MRRPMRVKGPCGFSREFRNPSKPCLASILMVDGLELRSADEIYVPAARKEVDDFLFGDPPWSSPTSRLPVAEDEHEVPPSGTQDGCEALRVRNSVIIGEDVEETAIDGCVELPVQGTEVERICNFELGLGTPLPRF